MIQQVEELHNDTCLAHFLCQFGERLIAASLYCVCRKESAVINEKAYDQIIRIQPARALIVWLLSSFPFSQPGH
jgi:hypothetical protein